VAKKVLIIDDEPVVAEAMAELVRALELEVRICTDPAEIEATFEAFDPQLVILDLMLPGTDGMKVGASLRKKPRGSSLGILAVSGVFKQASTAKELWSNLQADFIAKPFENKEFQAKVCARLGMAPPGQQSAVRKVTRSNAVKAPSASNFASDLSRDPVYRIYVRLYEQRASGHLLLKRGKAQRRISFHLGQIRFASSNLAKENVGGLQVASGQLAEEAFRKAIDYARTKKVGLPEALVAVRAMDGPQAARALAEQVVEVSTAAMGWADGDAQFQLDPAGVQSLPDHRNHPLAVLIEGVRRFYPPASIRAFLTQKSGAYVQRTQSMERENYTLTQAAPKQTLLTRISGQITLGALMSSVAEQDLSLLFALVGSGLLRLSPAPVDSAASDPAAPQSPSQAPTAAHRSAQTQSAPRGSSMPPGFSPTAGRAPENTPSIAPPSVVMQAASPQDLDAGKSFTPAELEAKSKIDQEYARLEDANFYELLAFSPNAACEGVQKAYLEMARTWHSDRFAGLDLGSSASRLESLFTRIGEARDTLSDKDKRAEYDVYLDRKQKGLPTDVAAILKAEEIFQQAERLVKAGKHQAALPLLDQAIELNHAEPEFHAYRAYARYRVQGDPRAAQQILETALRERPNLTSAQYFIAAIHLSEDELDEAERAFKKTLSMDPKHQEASASMRLVGKKREENKKSGGGLLGRFRKK